MGLQPDKTLLNYRLSEKIGEGGMGVVWRATDTTLNRDVAVKILPQVFAEDQDRVARFEREAKLLASLNHAHIATIHGLHQVDGVHFLAMQFIRGQSLDQVLEEVKRLLFRDAALILGYTETDSLDASKWKSCEDCSESPGEKYFQICDKYREIMSKCNYIDFDDQIHFACQILEKYPDILEKYQTQA